MVFHAPIQNKSIIDTTMIYLKRDQSYLLLYRNKKKNDINHNKWIGVGGRREENETIDECAIRETKEETGYDIHSLKCAGEVLFVDGDLRIMMYCYEVTDFSGTQIECNEGELRWIPIKDIYNYPMWEGDKAFLPLLINHAPYFKMELVYENGELIEVKNK